MDAAEPTAPPNAESSDGGGGGGGGSAAADATTTTTFELNLRLDADGRTARDPALLPPPTPPPPSSEDAPARKRARVEGASLDYSSKTISTALSLPLSPSAEKAWDELLYDCEVADCGLLPRTFWVPAPPPSEKVEPPASPSAPPVAPPAASPVAPRCALEEMALDVFRRHVPEGFPYDPATSGAEWWVQIRPSPPGTGRYSMLAADDDAAKAGISFHWDKDEDLRLMCGGSMYVHPHLSTVTYLTDLGAPTMVVSKRVDPVTGRHVCDEGPVEGYVSWPRRGKHLSFDGRYLHAAPSDLMEEGLFEEQCRFEATEGMDETAKKVLTRRHRRVTFLVNIWLNYKPFNVNPFPESMLDKLGKGDAFEGRGLFGAGDEESESGTGGAATEVNISEGKASIAVGPSTAKSDSEGSSAGREAKLSKMTWSMGQTDEERIEVLLPLELIRDERENGSNVAMTWDDGILLVGAAA
ncbi:hypothetical protein ACHAWF_013924 [Thalassiosira exigua]